MNLHDAQRLAISLMQQHGLRDWTFRFTRAKTQLGICKFKPRVIALSAPLTLLNDEAQVRDTILHEIAHALAGVKAGHGWKWKMIARSIGAKPERCESGEVAQPKGKYVLTCKNCGIQQPVYRVTKSIKQLMLEAQGKIPPGQSCYHAACGRKLGRLTIDVAK